MASRACVLLLCLALSVLSLCTAQTTTTTTSTTTQTATSTSTTTSTTTQTTTSTSTTSTVTATTTTTGTATSTTTTTVTTTTSAMMNANSSSTSTAARTTTLPATLITGEIVISVNDTDAVKLLLNDTSGKISRSIAAGLATKLGINASYITVVVSEPRRLSLRRLDPTLVITYEINIPAGESSAGVVDVLTKAKSTPSVLAELQEVVQAELEKEIPGIQLKVTGFSFETTVVSVTTPGEPIQPSGSFQATTSLSLLVLGFTMLGFQA